MYEHRSQPLLPPQFFVIRMLRNFAIASAIIFGSLGVGAAGYHFSEGLAWIDSVLNAAMILTGMGPVDPVRSMAGKLFATFYALFSGVVFLTGVAILFAPAFHRFLHRFHLEETETQADKKG